MDLKQILTHQQKNIDDLLTQEMSLFIMAYLSKKDENFEDFMAYFWQEIHKNTSELIKNVIQQLPEFQQQPHITAPLNQIIAEVVQKRIEVAKNVIADWKNHF